MITTTVHAAIPLWSFSPNGSPAVTLSTTDTATVSYTVANNSRKPRQLVLSSTTPSRISQTGGPCVLNESYTTAQSTCNTTYSNASASPFPASNAFATCKGANQCACDSGNILAMYDAYNTGYGMARAPTPCLQAQRVVQIMLLDFAKSILEATILTGICEPFVKGIQCLALPLALREHKVWFAVFYS
jgi:hypothetical protein